MRKMIRSLCRLRMNGTVRRTDRPRFSIGPSIAHHPWQSNRRESIAGPLALLSSLLGIMLLLVLCLVFCFVACRDLFGDSNISGPSDHGLFESQDTNAACTGDAQGSAEDRPWPRTKWGRCPLCEYSLKPRLYQSGPYRGSIRLLRSRFWILEDGRRQCWNSIPVPALMWSKLPRFLRQKYHELPASLLRNAQGP